MKKNILLLLFFCYYNLGFSQENTITIKNSELLKSEDIIEFDVIEQVPVYKGCNKKLNNTALRKCISHAINKHVLRNFNTKISDSLGLSGFSARIYTRFTIDKDGTVIDIKARGSHPKLEDEAKRVIKLIPVFDKPGIQKEKPVKVTFDLPITFNIKDRKQYKPNVSLLKDLDTFPIHKRCDETLAFNSQKECSTKKIVDFIKLGINMELANKLFPQDKNTKIKLDFIIDKKGKIKNITAKAHHIEMAKEAINVAKRLPKLKAPGYKNGKPVNVPFSILMTINF